MIIGTHLDAVNIKYDIGQCVLDMYSETNSFPRIADVCCVNSRNEGSIKVLKDKIYSVAIRLRYGRRNQCEPHLIVMCIFKINQVRSYVATHKTKIHSIAWLS